MATNIKIKIPVETDSTTTSVEYEFLHDRFFHNGKCIVLKGRKPSELTAIAYALLAENPNSDFLQIVDSQEIPSDEPETLNPA